MGTPKQKSKPWLRLTEAAPVAGVSPARLRQMIGSGAIARRNLRREGPMWFIRRRACEQIRDRPQTQGWPRGKPRPKRRK